MYVEWFSHFNIYVFLSLCFQELFVYVFWQPNFKLYYSLDYRSKDYRLFVQKKLIFLYQLLKFSQIFLEEELICSV